MNEAAAWVGWVIFQQRLGPILPRKLTWNPQNGGLEDDLTFSNQVMFRFQLLVFGSVEMLEEKIGKTARNVNIHFNGFGL